MSSHDTQADRARQLLTVAFEADSAEVLPMSIIKQEVRGLLRDKLDREYKDRIARLEAALDSTRQTAQMRKATVLSHALSGR